MTACVPPLGVLCPDSARRVPCGHTNLLHFREQINIAISFLKEPIYRAKSIQKYQATCKLSCTETLCAFLWKGRNILQFCTCKSNSAALPQTRNAGSCPPQRHETALPSPSLVPLGTWFPGSSSSYPQPLFWWSFQKTQALVQFYRSTKQRWLMSAVLQF